MLAFEKLPTIRDADLAPGWVAYGPFARAEAVGVASRLACDDRLVEGMGGGRYAVHALKPTGFGAVRGLSPWDVGE
jgi:hypothetical protein